MKLLLSNKRLREQIESDPEWPESAGYVDSEEDKDWLDTNFNIKEPEIKLHYPDMDTPNTALVVNMDECCLDVLAYTGRYFYAQCVDAGFNGEEVGISNVPLDPGYWVMEEGSTWESKDWESGYVDDYGIEGYWRKPSMRDFIRYDVDYPLALTWAGKIWYWILKQFIKPFDHKMIGDIEDIKK